MHVVVYGTAAGRRDRGLRRGQYFGTEGTISGLLLNGEPIEFEGRDLTTDRPTWDWDAQMRVLPHVVGPHREIPEAHVFEDIMQLVGLVRDGTPTAGDARACAARHRDRRSRLPCGRDRADPGPADDVRAWRVARSTGRRLKLNKQRACLINEDE